MLNHAAAPMCEWRALPSAASPEATPSLELRASRRRWPRRGEELTIRYAHEGNSGLLFKYGFVDDDNPADHVVLACPGFGPPGEWDSTTRVKSLLLKVRAAWILLELLRPPRSMWSCRYRESPSHPPHLILPSDLPLSPIALPCLSAPCWRRHGSALRRKTGRSDRGHEHDKHCLSCIPHAA
jgi:hypothetical protein